MVLRFFLIPFCVSSYSAIAVSSDFLIVFPQTYWEYVVTTTISLAFLLYVLIVKLAWRRVRWSPLHPHANETPKQRRRRKKQQAANKKAGKENQSESATVKLDELRQLLDLVKKRDSLAEKQMIISDVIDRIDRLLGWGDGSIVGAEGGGRFFAAQSSTAD